MNRLKNFSELYEPLKGSWFSFRQLNTNISDESLLSSIFQFNLLFIIFYEIIKKNENYSSNIISLTINFELLNYFNRNFCSNDIDLLIEELSENKFHVSRKNTKSKDKIIVTLEYLLELREKFFSRMIITDTLINELFLLSLSLNNYGEELVKELGVYYTPMKLAELITYNSISKFLQINELKEIKLLDTSCGTGNFLISTFKVLSEYYLSKIKKSHETKIDIVLNIIQNHIFGVDIDEWAIITCKLRFFFIINQNRQGADNLNINYSKIFKNFKKADFLATEITIKPTIIVGNPPWGKIGVNNYKHKLGDSFSFQDGQRDVYRFFIELSMKLDPLIFSLVTPDSWLEIPGAKTLKSEFLRQRKLETIFILPDKAFPVKTHFIAFLSIKSFDFESKGKINIKYLNNEMNVKKIVTRTVLVDEVRKQPLIQLINLDEDLYNFNRSLKDQKEFIKLGKVVDGTVGYQLYHNSIHSPDEINEKIFHSKIKYNDEWIPEIKAKNIKLFTIDYSNEYFVKKTATFFRIPQKIFIENDKLLLREVVSKEGLIVARSTKEILFPKSVISIILKEKSSERNLLTVMGYLASYICFFDLVVNGIKSNRKFFPRMSIATLKNLSFNYKLFDTNIWLLVKKMVSCTNDKQDEMLFSSLQAQLQAKIFYYYNMSLETALVLMQYLNIPLVMQEKVLKEFKPIVT